MITPEYRALNWALHSEGMFTGPDAAFHAPEIRRLAMLHGCRTLLDYGCGCCVLESCFDPRVLDWNGYDPCIQLYADDPAPADIVASIDVLEHVEPEHVPAVLDHLRSKVLKLAYLVIALEPDSTKLLPDGSNPHRSLHPPGWWESELALRFGSVERVPALNAWQANFVCKP